MMCKTVLISCWKSRRLRPFIKCDASLIPIRRKCFDVIIGAVVVVEIKMLEPDDLVKFNPFWQESGSIFEFHADGQLITKPIFFYRNGGSPNKLSPSPPNSS